MKARGRRRLNTRTVRRTGFPNPGDGKIVRVSPSVEAEDIVTGLVVPTAMTIGPDGALYVSNFGAAPPGLGQILCVDITD
jgi:hypothetical protein